MDRMRGRLFERFGELGIEAPTVPYPAHGSVEEGKALRGQLSGTFTKNLLIKDKKGRMYLMVVREDRALDLRTLHKQIGASGRLGFAGSDQMRSVLGIEPGALTPFATLNDTAGVVTLVIESALLGADRLNFHPLVQTESTSIRPQDLMAFIRSCDRQPIIVDLDVEESSSV